MHYDCSVFSLKINVMHYDCGVFSLKYGIPWAMIALCRNASTVQGGWEQDTTVNDKDTDFAGCKKGREEQYNQNSKQGTRDGTTHLRYSNVWNLRQAVSWCRSTRLSSLPKVETTLQSFQKAFSYVEKRRALIVGCSSEKGMFLIVNLVKNHRPTEILDHWECENIVWQTSECGDTAEQREATKAVLWKTTFDTLCVHNFSSGL